MGLCTQKTGGVHQSIDGRFVSHFYLTPPKLFISRGIISVRALPK